MDHKSQVLADLEKDMDSNICAMMASMPKDCTPLAAILSAYINGVIVGVNYGRKNDPNLVIEMVKEMVIMMKIRDNPANN
jgi:hypothetical protein